MTFPRCVGLDVHKRVIQAHFIEVDGKRRDIRFDLTRESLIAFAERELKDSHVVLEATTNTWRIVELVQPFCARVVVSNPMATKAIASAKIKTDKVDARVLADLLRADFLPTVWIPPPETRKQRAIAARRSALTRQSISLKNRIQSVLHGQLIEAPASLFCTTGRQWLSTVDLDPYERLEIDTLCRLLDALQSEQQAIALRLDQAAHQSLDLKLLITLPGVDVATAQALLAMIGDIKRFTRPENLAAYFGLVPSVHQSADKCYFGKITKQGSKNVRWLLIQAAHHAARHPGPLGLQFLRLQKKKCTNVAVVAIARKLAELAWQLLSKQEPYRYAIPSAVELKLQRIRTNATGEKRKSGPKKGSAKTPVGTPRTREKKSLDRVLNAESMPITTPAPAAEARVLKQLGASQHARQIQRSYHVSRTAEATP